MANFELPEGLRELTHAELRDLNEGDKISVYVILEDKPELNQVLEVEVKEVDDNDENRTIMFEIPTEHMLNLFGDYDSDTLGGSFVSTNFETLQGWTCKLSFCNRVLRSDAFIPVEVLEGYKETNKRDEVVEVSSTKAPETFKVDDYVYFPRVGNKVYKLFGTDASNYPIGCAEFTFTESGKILKEDHVPSIWHATEENRKKLEAFYGIEFAKPTNGKVQALQEHLKNGAIFLLSQSSIKPETVFKMQGAGFVEINEISDEAVEFVDGTAHPISGCYLENLHAVELTKTGTIVYL